METTLIAAGIAAAWVLALAGVLHGIGRLGAMGRWAAAACVKAPLLDVLILLFQVAPWVTGLIIAGWRGAVGALAGMLAGYFAWVFLHEITHLKAVRGARIVKSLNRIAGGRVRNHLAVWATALALPIFWFIRLGEILVYPLLVWLLGFPRYRHGEWVAVSRQKFDGLVGHDLVWCLYCDWMTGVYSLGAEMLRNVESFWCPIRFYDGKKCDNCAIDFPDVNKGWVRADGTMEEVTRKLEEMYGDGRREWFNHPARLTVNGREASATSNRGAPDGATP